MSKLKLEKVYFGARLAGYSGSAGVDAVGREGILAFYTHIDDPDVCSLAFYYDKGLEYGWVYHADSRHYLLIDDAPVYKRLHAESLRSGTVKLYDLTTAVELGADTFEPGDPKTKGVPDEWLELFANVFRTHFEWKCGDAVVFTIDGAEKQGVFDYIDWSDHRAIFGELLNIYVPGENTLYKEIPASDVKRVESSGCNN